MIDDQLSRVLIGTIVLLVLALLPVRRNSKIRRAYLGFIFGIALVMVIAIAIVHFGDFVLIDSGEETVKAQIDLMARDQANHIPKNLIIIEGSSQTALGIDGLALEDELHKAGYDVTVVKMVAAGGNHMERYAALKRFEIEREKHGLAISPNTRMMLELAPEYDLHPLIFFLDNRNTLRGYHYSNIDNFAYAIQSLRLLREPLNNQTVRTLGVLFRNTIVSGLNIGLLPDMRPFDGLSAQPSSPHVDQPQSGFRFRTYNANAIKTIPLKAVPSKWIAFTNYRTQRIAALFQGGITETNYFSVPVMNDMHFMRYVHAMCITLGSDKCIDATDPAIYGALDSAEYYYNIDHLTATGARIYSHYFAQQLIAKGIVIK